MNNIWLVIVFLVVVIGAILIIVLKQKNDKIFKIVHQFIYKTENYTLEYVVFISGYGLRIDYLHGSPKCYMRVIKVHNSLEEMDKDSFTIDDIDFDFWDYSWALGGNYSMFVNPTSIQKKRNHEETLKLMEFLRYLTLNKEN